jgi:hypothetical protein
MIKRQWPSFLVIIAFLVSMAHASIPHDHPTIAQHWHDDDHHNNSASSNGHDHHASHQHNDSESQRKLPVFTHFSNTDYLGNAFFKFSPKAKDLIALMEWPVIDIPHLIWFEKPILFPKARDLPLTRYRSVESLRAPPSFS